MFRRGEVRSEMNRGIRVYHAGLFIAVYWRFQHLPQCRKLGLVR